MKYLIKFKDGKKVILKTRYKNLIRQPFFKDVEWVEPLSNVRSLEFWEIKNEV